jgi:hypothetical protein
MSANSSPSLNKQAENIVQKELLNKLSKEQLEVLTQYAKRHPVNQPKNLGSAADTNKVGSKEKNTEAPKKEITVNNLRRNASRKNRKSRRMSRNNKRTTRINRR